MSHSRMIDHLEHVARLTHGRDREGLDATLVDVLRSVLQADQVTLWEVLADEEQQRLLQRLRHGPGQQVQGMPAWRHLADLPLLTQEPALAEAVHHGGPFVPPSQPCRLLVPLRTETQRRLVLDLQLPQPPDEQVRRVAEGMGRIYVNVINLLDASERDTLTGLLNRKSFDDTFYKSTRPAAEAAAMADRRAHTDHCWLGVIDVDHFKSVNDRFGHLIGDEVLLLMARLLRQTFRHDDRLYRFGGEEFVVLVRAEDAAAAAKAFERLRAAVEVYPFPQVGRITVSIGYTAVRPFDTPADAFERADRAVYLAKAQGRNAVRCFETDVAAQPAAEPLHHAGGGVELF
ncbi:MAG: GGDEF domain-containing protein [Tepidimonas sp.]|nr:GGDEF domain-containing protein [Tepidimonas sp.]